MIQNSGNRTAEGWAEMLTLILDLIAFCTLALTFEISIYPFAIAGTIFLVSRVSRFALSQRLLIGFYFALTLGTFFAWILMKTHPIVAASHALPVAHALVWLMPRESRPRGWRIGLGFIGLVLASALTTEFFVPLAITFFIVIASITLSCNFLANELSQRSPEHLSEPLPRSFIPASLGLSILIFLTAAIIFPLLPRIHAGGESMSGKSKTGYSEEVNIGEWTRFTRDDDSSAALAIFGENGEDPATWIINGLLRGTVLDSFDGKRWRPMPKPRGSPQRAPWKSNHGDEVVVFDAIREPLGSEILPIPYHATNVAHGSSDSPRRPVSLVTGEWLDLNSHARTSRYRFTLPKKFPEIADPRAGDDLPQDFHLAIPPAFDNDRMKRLAQSIFKGQKGEGDKIRALIQYFRQNDFQAARETGDPEFSTGSVQLSPVEKFLFVKKAGHCELFSSAAAILLRMAGIPTRLVAGFRLSRPSIGGVLVVPGSDAHAWIEAWTESEGWVGLDFTPRTGRQASILDFIRHNYAFLDAYWSRYILSYGERSLFDMAKEDLMEALKTEGSESWSERIRSGFDQHRERILVFGAILATAAALGFGIIKVYFPWIFSIRFRVREGPLALRRERNRLERLLQRRLKIAPSDSMIEPARNLLRTKFGEEAARALDEWEICYNEARFGSDALHPHPETHRIRICYDSLHRSLQNSA